MRIFSIKTMGVLVFTLALALIWKLNSKDETKQITIEKPLAEIEQGSFVSDDFAHSKKEHKHSEAHDHDSGRVPATAEAHTDKDSYEWLANKEHDINDRISQVTEMSERKNFETKEVIKLILSKNPYKEIDRGPHTEGAYLFKKEASLRVHSLKLLDHKLDKTNFVETFTQVMNHADDPTIRIIAREALAYKERGRSVFTDVVDGLRNEPLPVDTQ